MDLIGEKIVSENHLIFFINQKANGKTTILLSIIVYFPIALYISKNLPRVLVFNACATLSAFKAIVNVLTDTKMMPIRHILIALPTVFKQLSSCKGT